MFVPISFTNKQHSSNCTTFFITTPSKMLHSCIISMPLWKFTIDLLRPRSMQFSSVYLMPCQPHTTPAPPIAHARAVSQLSIKLAPCRTLISNLQYARQTVSYRYEWPCHIFASKIGEMIVFTRQSCTAAGRYNNRHNVWILYIHTVLMCVVRMRACVRASVRAWCVYACIKTTLGPYRIRLYTRPHCCRNYSCHGAVFFIISCWSKPTIVMQKKRLLNVYILL